MRYYIRTLLLGIIVKNRKEPLPLILLVVIIAVSTGMAALHNQLRQSPLPNGQQVIDKSSWPLTDYTIQRSTDPEIRARREMRGKKYDKSDFRVHPEDPSENTTKVDVVDPKLPSIPVTQSNLIVIGEVTSAQAYLSNDQTGVYSEFKVQIDDVLKSNITESVAPGSLIDAEREGGRVRFSSGRIHWYSVDKENMPVVGRRYVFFLTCEDQSLHILTAYELRGAKVVPLDQMPQFKTHDGENETEFLNTLRGLTTTQP